MNPWRQLFYLLPLLLAVALAWLITRSLAMPGQELWVFLCFFTIFVPLALILPGGGLRQVERDTAVIRKDLFGNVDEFREGSFLYLPLIHRIEARIPNYPLRFEFDIEAIDTRTPRIQRINRIRVRVVYRIVEFRTCYELSENYVERIQQLREERNLRPTDPGMWKLLMNDVVHHLVDDVVRTGVWAWADHIAQDPTLRLEVPFDNVPTPEHDPYALSLNRVKLAQKIADELLVVADDWGLLIDPPVFETIDIDPELIKGKTRNKERELQDAEHDARKAAIAIREKGRAEAEVRAHTVAAVIAMLLRQQERGVRLNDQLLYNVVRAAMYSDGEMIWNGVVEKTADSSVKAA